MKHLIAIFLVLFVANHAMANAIDSLKTNEDVVKFLKEKIGSQWDGIFTPATFAPNIENRSQYGKDTFFKADIDKNGQTDLIVNGNYLLVVTDSGHDSYCVDRLERDAFTWYVLSKIIYRDNTPLLIVKHIYKYAKAWDATDKTPRVVDPVNDKEWVFYYTEVPDNDSAKWKSNWPVYDTLIYKFGRWIEYNECPEITSIEHIHITIGGHEGGEAFDIEPDRKALYYDDDGYGEFEAVMDHETHAVVDQDTYDRIVKIITYLRISTLKEEYPAYEVEGQRVYLEIKYNNGQIKKIADHGSRGTFGLRNLYDQLYRLKETQKWE